MTNTYVIVGASHAGVQLAFGLRQQGWDGRIVLVGEELHTPYHRPPLSKEAVTGGTDYKFSPLRKPEAYEHNKIELELGLRVTAIDVGAKQLALANGKTLSFNKLALCIGAKPRYLKLPGVDLPGVHYLRSADDVTAIRAGLDQAKRAVIVGGGYIGLELAATLRQRGLQVTVLEAEDRLLARVAATHLSDFFAAVHRAEGVQVETQAVATGFHGETHVTAVETADGRRFLADLVVVGIGVMPETTLADAAGLAVNNGISVNRACQTSQPDIYAVGDCANRENSFLQTSVRLESVPNTLEHAKAAAAAACGVQMAADAAPWFWSDQYDMKLQMAGMPSGDEELLLRGEPQNTRSFAAFYIKAGRVVAAACVNRPKEFMAVRNALNKGLDFDLEKLPDDSIAPDQLLQS